MDLFSNEKEKVYDQYSDIIKWLNTATLIYPETNKWSEESLSGNTINTAAEILINWAIVDKETADHCMKNLYNGGGDFNNYKTKIGALVKEMRGKGIKNSKDKSIKSILKKCACVYIQQKYPEIGIIASDLSMGIYLSSRLYLVGIYSFEEAMSTSIKMAQKLQKLFNSWDDCIENIFWGLQCKLGISRYNNDPELIKVHRLYNKIKNENNGVYPVQWDLTLTDEWNASNLTYPDTVKWFNAAKGPFNVFNTVTPHIYWPLLSKQLIIDYLTTNWNIHNQQEAAEILKNLLKGKPYNQALLQEWKFMNSMSSTEYVSHIPNKEEYSEIYYKSRYHFVHYIMENYPSQGIIAYDLYCAIHLLSCYYVVGYLTYEEALDVSLVVGKSIQNNFVSWDDYMNNYFLGYQILTNQNLENPHKKSKLKKGELLNFNNYNTATRRKIYQWLKEQKDSVYNIPWNLELKKEW